VVNSRGAKNAKRKMRKMLSYGWQLNATNAKNKNRMKLGYNKKVKRAGRRIKLKYFFDLTFNSIHEKTCENLDCDFESKF